MPLLQKPILHPAINLIYQLIGQFSSLRHSNAAAAKMNAAKGFTIGKSFFCKAESGEVNAACLGGNVMATSSGAVSVENGFDAGGVRVLRGINLAAIRLGCVVGVHGVVSAGSKKKREKNQKGKDDCVFHGNWVE